MNDCVFSCICEGGSCGDCKDYISMNSDLGRSIKGEYWRRVNEACKPVHAWLESFRSGDAKVEQ